MTTVTVKRAPARRGGLPYRRTVLRNGLRVVTQAMPHARSVAAGLFVGVGSRHEAASQAGLSHLLEHLVFKGTRAYPAPGGLSEAIESVGGSVNASTDRELTVYTSKVPAAHADRALDVVAELVARPLLRHADLTAEKPVIVDEIRMYVDSPGDHVFTMFDELLFGEHPLGREVAGTPRSVRRATPGAVRGHWERWYRPEHAVLAVAGALDDATIVEAAAHWWGDLPPAPRPTRARSRRVIPFGRPHPTAAGAIRVVHRDLSQGNLCLGMPGVARDHPDRWALDLLGAVLGDGMSSRLFLELRERRSLAYDVATFAASYADCGTFGVHAGFDPDHAEEVVVAVQRELERICREPVEAHELERARAYTRGRLELRMEDTGAVAAWLGTGESLLPRILTVDEVVAQLEAVTPADLLRVARRWVRPDLVRVAVLGPFRGRSRFRRALAPWLGERDG
ncbi:MAG TPA: pitrilysin family protein [Candidatus Limnocylindria bacterium]|nr:pitrilysin family protein [Candidatus Limnocylindria bacterium]